MLHIIVWILRILGILLLIVLGLLLLALLLLLFVPLRYEAEAKKKEERLAIRARVRWLARLVRVNAVYRDKEMQATIFLLGRPFKKMRFGGKKAAPAPAAGDTEVGSSGIGKPETAAEKEKPKTAAEKEKPETASKVPSRAEKLEERRAAVAAARTGRDKAQAKETAEDGKAEARRRKGAAKAGKANAQRMKEPDGFFAKMLRNIHKAPEVLTDLLLLISGDELSVSGTMGEKIRKLGKTADVWASPQMRDLYRKVLRLLLRVWKHWRPRALRGWLRYGAPEPDLTGELTGLLYLLLPKEGEGYGLYPDFTQKRLETDTTLSGHIRLCWAALAVLILLPDRRIWKVIGRLRGKGGE